MPPKLSNKNLINKIHCGDSLEIMRGWPDGFIDCCITSPPYWGLRDYGVGGQLGLEKTPEEYVAKLVAIFDEVRRVLKPEGTLWLNLGDSYAGSGKGSNSDGTAHPASLTGKQGTHKGTTNGLHVPQKAKEIGLKAKDLVGIPWAVAFALRSSGWYLRQDIIWAKTNPMPESVKDRCTKSHEYIFLMSKSQKYFFDHVAIKEDAVTVVKKSMNKTKYKSVKKSNGKYSNFKEYGGGGSSFKGHSGMYKSNGEPITSDGKRNKRDVWVVSVKPYKEAHFATYPPDLILPCVLAGCPKNGIIFDPFMGAGTTAVVACRNNRNFIGIELNPEYIKIANDRIKKEKG